MLLKDLLYIGAAGLEAGVYLAWAQYFFMAPKEGRRYVRFIAAMCLALNVSAVFDVIVVTSHTLNLGNVHQLNMLDYMLYFIAIPLCAALLLSMLLPHKSNRWLMRFILYSEIVPVTTLITQAIVCSDVIYQISWGYVTAFCIGMFIYCEVKLSAYEKAIRNIFSETSGRSAWWMHILMAIFMVTIAMYAIAAISKNHTFDFIVILLNVINTILICNILDYQKSISKYIISGLEDGNSKDSDEKDDENASVSADEAIELTNAYSSIAKKLKELFEEKKLFLEPDITSHDVASIIGTNNRYLSYFLNNVMEKSFHSYIRELRVNYAKTMIEGNESIPLADVAYKSGFNSPTTFSLAFRNVFNSSPKTYKQEYFKRKREEREKRLQTVAAELIPDFPDEEIRDPELQEIRMEDVLKPREMMLCKLIMEGKSNEEVSAEMDISRESLRVVKSRILKKLDPDGAYHDLKKWLSDSGGLTP